MKKLIFASVALAATISANAQITSTTLESSEVQHPQFSTTPISRGAGSVASSASVAANVDTIFSETFGNGLAGDGSNGAWTNHGTSTSGGSTLPANWEYRGTSTNPNNTVGSRGAYTAAAELINSPSRNNGFMIFDSDYLDNNGNQGQAGTGTAPTPHWGILESPSFDVSGYQDVVLVMNSYMRRFAATTYVTFSLNGGTTWQDSLVIHGETDIPVNDANETDNTVFFDISSTVGGQSNVKMRFLFEGVNNAASTQAPGYYHWQIDDIAVLSKPDYDLEMLSVGVTGKNDTVVGVREHHYTRIPATQSAGDTLKFAGRFLNKGVATQSGTKIEVELGGTVVATSNTPISIASGVHDSIEVSTDVIPSTTVGDYFYTVSVSGDSTEAIPADNSARFRLTVTDSTYRYGRGLTGGRNLTNSGAYEVCAGFEFWFPDTLGYVELEFSTWNPASANLKEGDALKVTVRDSNLDEIMSYKNASTGDFYIVPANQADDRVRFGVPVAGTNGNTNAIAPGLYYGCYATTRADLSLGVYDETEGVFDNDDIARTAIKIGTGNWSRFRFIPTIGLITTKGCSESTLSASANVVDDQTPAQGKLNASANGGLPTYSYAWEGPNSFTASTKEITSLGDAGAYTVTVTDALGCSSTSSATLGNCVTYQDITGSIAEESKVGFPKALTLTVNGGSGNYSYSWTGPNSFTATTKDITATEQGEYTVVISDDDCSGVTDKTIKEEVLGDPDSAGDVEILNAVSMYPNPSNGNFDVKIEGVKGSVEMIITNVTGQTVLTKTIAASGATVESVDLTQNGAGVYFIEIKHADKTATFRAVVK